MLAFKIGKVEVGKRVAQLMLAFFIGWLCGCSDSQQSIGGTTTGGKKVNIICLKGTQYYSDTRGQGQYIAPVIIKGEYQECSK